jgi:hypothetical protein
MSPNRDRACFRSFRRFSALAVLLVASLSATASRATAQFQIIQPDLQVTAITFEGTYGVRVFVRNSGFATASACLLSVRVLSGNTWYVRYAQVPPLPRFASTSVLVTTSVSLPYRHYGNATVDATDLVTETNEANNARGWAPLLY